MKKIFKSSLILMAILGFGVLSQANAQTTNPSFSQIEFSKTATLPTYLQKSIRNSVENGLLPACADYYHIAAEAFQAGIDPGDNVHIIDDVVYTCKYLPDQFQSALSSALSRCTLSYRYFGPYQEVNQTCTPPISARGDNSWWSGGVMWVSANSDQRLDGVGAKYPDTSKGVICVADVNFLYQQERSCDQAAR